MKIVRKSFVDELMALVENTKKNIKIISPFVKENIYNQSMLKKASQVKFELITTFNFSNFCSTQSDLSVLRAVTETGGKVKINSTLNANIYIFDDKKALISSANFTDIGGERFEYGLLIDDKILVAEILVDYNNLVKDEKTRAVKKFEMELMEKIIQQIYKVSNYKKSKFSQTEIDQIRNTSDVVEVPFDAISSVFEGWQQEVLNCINLTQHQIFVMDELIFFENHLKKLFPTQKNIHDKIGIQLDYFAELGLISRLDNGIYKKLWR